MKNASGMFVAGLLAVVVFAVGGANGGDDGYWMGAQKLREGVLLKELAFTEPRLMKAHMMRIDLKTPGISFVATERDSKWGERMPDYTNGVMLIRTRRETTVDFLERKRREGKKVEIAVNTAGWEPFCYPWNHQWANPVGWTVSDGVEVCPTSPGRGALFIVRKDGSSEITGYVPPSETNQVAFAMCGFELIATNRVDISNKQDTGCHPRTAFGISADRRYLYLLAVDGRQPEYSLGADLRDLNRMVFAAGGVNVINMDGGGSTSLVYRDPRSGETVTVNRHAQNRRRAVAVNLGICFD